MAFGPDLTFNCEFAAERCQPHQPVGSIASLCSESDVVLPSECWTGQGSSRPSDIDKRRGIAGPRPQFVLRAGWLTLFPSEGWTRSLPLGWFADVEPPRREVWLAACSDAIKAAIPIATSAASWNGWDGSSYSKALHAAKEDALWRRGLTRDLASYSVFVGEALGRVLRIGDEFRFSHNGYGYFCYSAVRKAETVFSAGSVRGVDGGGPLAVWQEYDRHPNPDVEAVKKLSPNLPVAEWIDVQRSYVSVRIKDQMFRLFDGEEALIEPYFVFLARSRKTLTSLPPFDIEAVHCAGRLGPLGKELFIDAARQLTAPRIKIL
jgi:hypothetical protein